MGCRAGAGALAQRPAFWVDCNAPPFGASTDDGRRRFSRPGLGCEDHRTAHRTYFLLNNKAVNARALVVPVVGRTVFRLPINNTRIKLQGTRAIAQEARGVCQGTHAARGGSAWPVPDFRLGLAQSVLSSHDTAKVFPKVAVIWRKAESRRKLGQGRCEVSAVDWPWNPARGG